MDAKTSAKNKTGTLTVGNNNWDMPIYPGTIGPEVVDISKLYAQSGMFTYDPGFTSTASCESKITYIDGDEGILLYRGYPIEQLAEQSSFLEVCYLLLHGELPTASEFAIVADVSPTPTAVPTRKTPVPSATALVVATPMPTPEVTAEPTPRDLEAAAWFTRLIFTSFRYLRIASVIVG